jgi:ribosomal protein S6--L-glutamate ligase
MMPHTLVIARRAELMDAVTYCARNRIGELVTKQEGMHCGHGIRRWDSAETLYNTVAFTDSVYPFVLQPLQTDIADVRVIVVGDYVEAYLRENLFNFRANLAAGGVSRPLAIDPAAEDICRKVMSRGRFPYGHIDLHLSAGGMVWLSEITLDGGIVAARIGRKELQRRKQEVLERLAEMESGSELKDTSKQGGIP